MAGAHGRPGFRTLAIHAGERADPVTRAHNTPIYQTASFTFETAEEKEAAMDGGGHFYTRTSNPTTAALETKLAALEGAEAAVVGASGMGAVATTLFSLLDAGDHLVASDDVFIISRFLLQDDLPKKGIEVTFVDITNLAAVRAAIRSNTKVLYTESLSNPNMYVADLPALASIAREHGLTFVVDNTFLGPYLLRPLEHGADLVLHSATKYIAGHGDTLSGVVAGPKALIDPIRYQLDVLGSCASPFNSWLVLRGVRTLGLRMEAHCANAMELARFVERQPEVDWIRYPGLERHPNYAVARALLGEKFGGMFSFRLRGGRSVMNAFADALEMCDLGVSLGDVYTLVYPMPKRDNLIRVSVGCENVEDIIADFEQALERAGPRR